MASHFLARAAFSPLPSVMQCCIHNHTHNNTPSPPPPPPPCLINTRWPPYKTNILIFHAARLLGPPARFDASKLKVAFKGKDHLHRHHHHPHHNCTSSSKEVALVNVPPAPRIYTLSHCDFTANLTLTVSNLINLDQVLQAILHGDSVLFREHPELVDATVWVYFHSSSAKCNRVECWGPLKDAAQRQQEDGIHRVVIGSENGSRVGKWGSGKSVLQALFTFLL